MRGGKKKQYSIQESVIKITACAELRMSGLSSGPGSHIN